MKTLIAALLATAIASPVLAQEADRAGSPEPVRVQSTTTTRAANQHAKFGNAYAYVGNVQANHGTDPDPFIRSQLPRDAVSN
ncbi:hypothetical protein RA307_13495 [Xanthobacteraceae bacterium Astr-EGSB]|uniref:hypothetical protein n=1 Tax=Astrobacterium formosum TaxID=3069710 RepID=UPI0027B79476|nr:hypothetical protein [Xanthobacteraceae bacterium Astr-EGSB]